MAKRDSGVHVEQYQINGKDKFFFEKPFKMITLLRFLSWSPESNFQNGRSNFCQTVRYATKVNVQVEAKNFWPACMFC